MNNITVKKNNRFVFVFLPMAVIYLVILYSISIIFQNEAIYVYKWYAMILLIGIPFTPITNAIFSKFRDRGYFFSKTIGIALCAMLFFWLSTFKILRFTNFNCLLVYVVLGLLILCISRFKLKKVFFVHNVSSFKMVFAEEIVFLAVFVFLMYIKAFRPSACNVEDFMNYGFMSSISKTEYFPVEDFWFSGTNLNYYYIGQYIATFLTKLSFNKVEFTYNLMLMTICALSCILAFSITFKLLETLLTNAGKSTKQIDVWSTIGGVFSSLAICFMGNFHYILYNWIIPFLSDYCGFDIANEDKSYWFSDSTRYIGYNPDRPDKTIHEFPSYSFVLGNLHAHVINIVFVLTIIGVLVAFAIKNEKLKKSLFVNELKQWKNIDMKIFIKELFSPTVLLVGFFIGLFQGTNYWDFPIYFVVAGAIILFINYRDFGISLEITLFTFLQGVVVWQIGTVIIYPFSIGFVPMQSGIRLADNRTLLHQFLILWLFPIMCGLIQIIITIRDYVKNKKIECTLVDEEEKKYYSKLQWIEKFIKEIDASDIVMFLIACCAIGLLFVPEFIYIKDIYGSIYARCNTMFKTVYQSFIMFGIVTGYIIVKLLAINASMLRKVAGTILVILTLCCTAYFGTACRLWFGDVTDKTQYKTISALHYLQSDSTYVNDKKVIEHIIETISDDVTILEACGASYTAYNRISVATGNSTVLGWHTHEWLWKNNIIIVDERSNHVETIYTTTDLNVLIKLVKLYDIDYVYIGDLEYEKYGAEKVINSMSLMSEFSTLRFSTEISEKTGYPSYLYKINKERLLELYNEFNKNSPDNDVRGILLAVNC